MKHFEFLYMSEDFLMWLTFGLVIFVLLVLDLGFFHKNDREIKLSESIGMSFFYIVIAMLFGCWIFYQSGINAFSEYLTGYLLEKTLALDNIFVISLIFSTFSVPSKYQYRVLFWGIIGVIVLRAIMIGSGIQLINQFHWVLYIFSLLMIFTGIKMFFVSGNDMDIKNNLLLSWIRKRIRVTDDFHGHSFFIYDVDKKLMKKRLFITPLFLALIMVEFADLMFSVDSIPAIFAITQDPFIVYTSNIFAVLGLRALYFSLQSVINRFYYLKYSLAMILIFIGAKVIVADMLGIPKVPATLSLLVTVGLLIGGVFYSFWRSR